LDPGLSTVLHLPSASVLYKKKKEREKSDYPRPYGKDVKGRRNSRRHGEDPTKGGNHAVVCPGRPQEGSVSQGKNGGGGGGDGNRRGH